MGISEKSIKAKLKEVLDPELNISIVDMGLIYDVSLDKKNHVTVLMTLTTVGCPLIDIIEEDVKTKLKELGIKEKNIEIKLTFDPPWSVDRMSKKAKTVLGI